jgi:hypothetical protein
MDKRPWYKRVFGMPQAKASSGKESIAQKINWPNAGKPKKPKSGWQKPRKSKYVK